ncbi:hypothetical protein BDV10DRAFT_185296 [Aspergillus recurvatus]
MDKVFNDPVALEAYIQDATDRAVSNARLRVLDWVDARRAHSPRAYELQTVEIADERPLLRVLFLKPKWPLDGLPLLIERYRIPIAFLDGGIFCWFDYLCKNITVADIPGSEPVISDPSPRPGQHIRQSDFTWTRAGFFLRRPIGSKNRYNVTMICFGADMVYDRLRRLSCEAVREGVMKGPMSLLVVVLRQLSAEMDETVWDLSRVFGRYAFLPS